MTTLAELCETAPPATAGVTTQIVYGVADWRHVIQVADPAAGAAVVWHDVTRFDARTGFAGYDYERGADSYGGRYRASVATIDLWADDDRFAPWNPDTSTTYGVNMKQGPGLLIRSVIFQVSGGVVVGWLPRFTLKVESWSDASYSHGRRRQHRIVARDLITSLVGLPLPAYSEENWSDRVYHLLTDSGWAYGSLVYGAQFEADTTTPILLLPDRPASTSAVNEFDATLDPVGLVWFTDRYGHLVIRPRVEDTFHASAFAAGATGNALPSTVSPCSFNWAACEATDFDGIAAYAVDSGDAEPFGLDETETGVINHVKVSDPLTAGFDDDDPLSIQRFDRHTFLANWIAANDVVAADLLAFRANATVEARPLLTTVDLAGFMSAGPSTVDYLGAVSIVHRNSDDGLSCYANGWLRGYREQIAPRGCDIDWALTVTVDVYDVEADAGLLPVEDLTLVDVSATTAAFSWTNPAQTITPTHTQIRLLSSSSLWLWADYPITGASWASLTPSTLYEFQVRLIRVVDDQITHYSPTRSIGFATLAPTAPVIDVDDDGNGDATLPPPAFGCYLEWKLESSTTGAAWVLVDDGEIHTAPYVVDLSPYTFDPALLYRVSSREVCAGVPEDWTESPLFAGACADAPIMGSAPYNDASLVAYWPAVCPPDVIVEQVTEQPATHGPHFDGFVRDGAGSVVLKTNGDGVTVYGIEPDAMRALHADTTIAVRALLSTQPDAPVVLFGGPGLFIEAVPHGAVWRVRAKANEAGGGTTTISGGTDLPFGAWRDFAITHDVGADDLKLYINGVVDAQALGTVGSRTNFGLFQIGASDNGLVTNCAVWDRVLAPSELPGYLPPVTVTINKAAGQADPTTGSPILFTVVFSEAVTGFASADVNLAGTAGATTAVVSGTGPTYTVAVSGMTGGGTVIASIPAGVAASVATGGANLPSTSTDNTVDYTATVPITFVGAVGGFTYGVELPYGWLPGDYALVAVWNTVAGTLTVPAWLTRLDTAAGGSGNPGLYGGWLADGLGLNMITGGGANAILKPGSYLFYTGTENGHFHMVAIYRNVSTTAQVAQLVKETLSIGNTAVGPIDVASNGAGVLACLANTGAASPGNATHFRFATGVERVKTESNNRADRLNDVLGASSALSFVHDGVDPSGLNVANHAWAVALNSGPASYAPVNAISYVGAGANAATSAGSTLTVPLPAGLAAGDLIVCAVRGQENPGLPYWAQESGWAMVQGVTLGKRVTTLFFKRATGSDSDPTFDSNHGAGVPKQGKAFAYRNVGGMIWSEHGGGNTMTPVRNTAPVAGTVALAATASDFYGNAAVGTANGYTQRGAVGTADGSGSMAFADKTIATAGATIGYPVWTANNPSFMGSTFVLLVPN